MQAGPTCTESAGHFLAAAGAVQLTHNVNATAPTSVRFFMGSSLLLHGMVPSPSLPRQGKFFRRPRGNTGAADLESRQVPLTSPSESPRRLTAVTAPTIRRFAQLS